MPKFKAGARLSRVNELRCAALKLINDFGRWETVSGMNFRTADVGSLRLSYRTPFQKVSKSSERLKYLAAMHKIDVRKNPPYGLDIWSGAKVLNVEWDDTKMEIVSFHRGEWEMELLSTAAARIT